MSDVVLRCPTCGTTQSHRGECDACSDGNVRYFCSNHSPGLWLDAQECEACGARFGETSAKPRPPSTRPIAPVSPRRTPRSEFLLSKPRSVDPARTRPKRLPDPLGTPRAPSVADLLARLLAARRERAGYKEEGERWGESPPEIPRPRLGGCVVRFIMFALLLLTLLVAGSFLFVGGVLQMFMGQAASRTESAALLAPRPAVTGQPGVAELTCSRLHKKGVAAAEIAVRA